MKAYVFMFFSYNIFLKSSESLFLLLKKIFNPAYKKPTYETKKIKHLQITT